ncbi:MAG: pilin [Candidatus Pacebacteria bacterium]|nr:pilin [Candidatus Paceibacterota bacterium]MDD5356703.1 pilin [Candidatus Paceibacterota bacterium]
MKTVEKVEHILKNKSAFFFGIFFVLISFLILGALPSSASAATWCSKDPNNVVHVFGSGPACTQGRDASWNVCGTCVVWCAIGKDKKAVNAFPTNDACVQSIANSGVSGGSCRQCTSTDIATINNKLKGYYGTSKPTNGSLFNFNLNGILLGFGSGSYMSLYSADNTINQTWCAASGGGNVVFYSLSSCVAAAGSPEKCSPCQDQGAGNTTPLPTLNTEPGAYCDANGTNYPSLSACVNSQANQGIDSPSCGPCSDPALGGGPHQSPAPFDLGDTGKKPFDLGTTGGSCSGSNGRLPNPLGNTCDLYTLLNKILKVAEQIGGVIIVLAIIYTGFLFVKARGNSEELETAKRAFMWTVIGAGVLLGATVLSKIIENTIKQLQ